MENVELVSSFHCDVFVLLWRRCESVDRVVASVPWYRTSFLLFGCLGKALLSCARRLDCCVSAYMDPRAVSVTYLGVRPRGPLMTVRVWRRLFLLCRRRHYSNHWRGFGTDWLMAYDVLPHAPGVYVSGLQKVVSMTAAIGSEMCNEFQ